MVGTVLVVSLGIGSEIVAFFSSLPLVLIVTFHVIPVGLFPDVLAPVSWPVLAISLPPDGWTTIGISTGPLVLSILIVSLPDDESLLIVAVYPNVPSILFTLSTLLLKMNLTVPSAAML